MELEEVGRNPQRLACAVLDQLGVTTNSELAAINLPQIAGELDIVDVQEKYLDGFEGALLMAGNRARGAIVVNCGSGIRRRRFTLAHELGHWLNLGHEPTSAQGFGCRASDMAGTKITSEMSRHQRQEREANRFAIDLIAPPRLIKRIIDDRWSLRDLTNVAGALKVSKQALAHQFTDLGDEAMAVLFSKDGRCVYPVWTNACPKLDIGQNSTMPMLPSAVATDGPSDGLSNEEPAEWSDWFTGPQLGEVTLQTLHQSNGYAMTLVRVDEVEDGTEDDELEEAYARYTNFGS